MLVTAIRSLTKQKFQVEVDEELTFVLYKGELSHYNIEVGEEIPDEIYEEIQDIVLVKRAKLYSMHLLQKKDYAEKELYMKLKRSGYPQTAVEKAVSYVKSYGYVNDEEYVRRYITWQKEQKGKNRIIMELCQKGIDKNLIQQVMEEEEFTDEKEQVRILLKKKRKETGNLSEKEFRRLFGYLARKGYESSLILQVLKEEGAQFD